MIYHVNAGSLFLKSLPVWKLDSLCQNSRQEVCKLLFNEWIGGEDWIYSK